jgi:energy-coupling factor transporter ATP-binding protein EcfA2
MRMIMITGLIGRDALVEQIAREARKGRHLILTGPVGIGKSAVLEAVIDRLLLRQQGVVIQVSEQQAKGPFLEIARGLLESGLLKPSELELDPGLDALDPAALEWAKRRRSVNRLSIRDLTAAMVPALHNQKDRVLIAVDDLTAVTPTLVAFWLAILDAAQLLACASARKANVANQARVETDRNRDPAAGRGTHPRHCANLLGGVRPNRRNFRTTLIC